MSEIWLTGNKSAKPSGIQTTKLEFLGGKDVVMLSSNSHGKTNRIIDGVVERFMVKSKDIHDAAFHAGVKAGRTTINSEFLGREKIEEECEASWKEISKS